MAQSVQYPDEGKVEKYVDIMSLSKFLHVVLYAQSELPNPTESYRKSKSYHRLLRLLKYALPHHNQAGRN